MFCPGLVIAGCGTSTGLDLGFRWRIWLITATAHCDSTPACVCRGERVNELKSKWSRLILPLQLLYFQHNHATTCCVTEHRCKSHFKCVHIVQHFKLKICRNLVFCIWPLLWDSKRGRKIQGGYLHPDHLLWHWETLLLHATILFCNKCLKWLRSCTPQEMNILLLWNNQSCLEDKIHR